MNHIFEELGFLPKEAENLRIRSDLMIKLKVLQGNLRRLREKM